MSFLASRFQQLKDDLGTQDLFKTFTISDYYIIKSLIFAKKTLQKDEYNLYTRFFNIIHQQLPKPELFVFLYLETPKLKKNILSRGRPYERDIESSYLDKIQEGYFEYMKQSDLRILILDTNNIDFVKKEEDYLKVVDAIDKEYPKGIHRITF